MTIDFTCQKCEAGFELAAQDLIEGTEKLECPHCGQKAPTNIQEDFVAALTEMRTQVAVLSKKFTVALTLESEDLEDELEDEDEEADEGEESEDDELDFDEDEDAEDEEDYDDDQDER